MISVNTKSHKIKHACGMIIGLLLKAPSLDYFPDSFLAGLLAALLGHLAPHSPTAQDLRNICSFLLLAKRGLSMLWRSTTEICPALTEFCHCSKI